MKSLIGILSAFSILFSLAIPALSYAQTVSELPAVPSNFNINDWLEPRSIPGKYSEFEGAFRFICNVSKLGQFDPIVYPGQETAGHLHTFFGNTNVSPTSTYASLRASGDSSCQGGPLNRSAYWMPSLMREDGKVVIPSWIGIYYKGESPDFATRLNSFAITDKLPRGLRYVFDSKVPNVDGVYGRDTNPTNWVCFNTDGTTSGVYHSIKDLITLDPIGCKSGGEIMARGSSAPCWDGRLDSPDHRSHMAYPGYGDWGYLKCPADHPHRLVQFTILVDFRYDSVDELKTWFLSSDRMPGMPVLDAGSSLHFDWFGAWDDTILDTWHEFCIRQRGDGSGFDLCNGTGGKRPSTFTFNQLPRLWDPPAMIMPSTTAAPTVSLTGPATITAGQPATLLWSSVNATSCSGTNFTANGTSGSVTVTPTVSTAYSITCTGAGGSATASTMITVSQSTTPPPPPPTTCTENWSCTTWSACSTTGTQTRTCTDLNNCGTTTSKPSLTQSCTPTPTPSSFGIGTRVKTTANLNVRSKASNGKGIKILCTQPTGSLGTIVSGPASAGGYTWWNINYDTKCDGWSVQTYLTTSLAEATSESQVAGVAQAMTALQQLETQLKALLQELQNK